MGSEFGKSISQGFSDARTGAGDPNCLAIKVTFQCLNFNLELRQRISVVRAILFAWVNNLLTLS
jgi:hypothetical protein